MRLTVMQLAITMVRISLFATLGLALLTGACKSPLVACNLNLVYGLIIVVTDSSSGAPLGGVETIVRSARWSVRGHVAAQVNGPGHIR